MFLKSRNATLALKLHTQLGLVIIPIDHFSGEPSIPNWKPSLNQDKNEVKKLWKMHPNAIPLSVGNYLTGQIEYNANSLNVTNNVTNYKTKNTKRNFAEKVRKWIENAPETFHIKDCNISNKAKDEVKIRVTFSRLVTKNVISRIKGKRGYYKKSIGKFD